MSAAPQPEDSSLDDLFASYTLALKRLANALRAVPHLPPELFDRRATEELLAIIQSPDGGRVARDGASANRAQTVCRSN